MDRAYRSSIDGETLRLGLLHEGRPPAARHLFERGSLGEHDAEAALGEGAGPQQIASV